MGSWRREGPCEIEFSVSGPPPGWFQGLGPCLENKNTFSAVTRPLQPLRGAAGEIFWTGHLKSANISLKIEGESCVLAHPMESDVAMHTCGSGNPQSVTVRYTSVTSVTPSLALGLWRIATGS